MRVTLEAETLPELFTRAAQEVSRHLYGSEPPGDAVREKIVLEAPDLSALLYQWIEALLRAFKEQRMVFGRFEIHQCEASGNLWRLRADVTGDWSPAQTRTLQCRRVNVIKMVSRFEAECEWD